MSTAVVSDQIIKQPEHVMPEVHYLNNDHSLKSWLLTVDHKRICILYMLTITAMFFIGGFFASLVRLELLTPAGDLRSLPSHLPATDPRISGLDGFYAARLERLA